MNSIDTIIIISLGISMIYSLYKGMTREIFSLVAVFAGYLAANNYYQSVSSLLYSLIPNKTVCALTGFFIIFIFVTIIISIIGRLVKRFLRMSKALSLMDRFGGGVIGLLKGVLIISLILIPINIILPSAKKKILYNSKIAPYLLSSSRLLSKLSYNSFTLPDKADAKKIIKNIQGAVRRHADVLKNLKKDLQETVSAAQPQPKSHIPERDKKKLNRIIDENEGG